MAPESLQKKKYSKKTDVWSFGIVGTNFFSLQMNISTKMNNKGHCLSFLLTLCLSFSISQLTNDISYSFLFLLCLKVYEITAQREPHVKLAPKEVARLIRYTHILSNFFFQFTNTFHIIEIFVHQHLQFRCSVTKDSLLASLKTVLPYLNNS